MVLYTLNRDFEKVDVIDNFESVIWTERYRGDGDFKLIVPATDAMLDKLPKGQLMICDDLDQPMILETRDIKDGLLETTGIAIAPWLNNRIIRTTNNNAIREFTLTDKPGEIIMQLAVYFAMPSMYNNGAVNVGIAVGTTARFGISGLGPGETDTSGTDITVQIPFGPLYDPMKQLAEAYEIGIAVRLNTTPIGTFLTFNTYTGANRTSEQSVYPTIRFSKDMNNFTNIHDLESIAEHRNLFFVFPSTDVPAGYVLGPAEVDVSGGGSGFDLKVFQGFADRLPDGSPTHADIKNALSMQAKQEWAARKIVQLVDGEITQVEGIEYGQDYFLGDLVEAQGNTGVIQKARITEYIRSQDAAGEKAYPTVTFLD